MIALHVLIIFSSDVNLSKMTLLTNKFVNEPGSSIIYQ